ncbi:MAG: acetyl-CoA carboxylase biotin carboxyl carrier protein [Flavobacteriaceae bacterium]|jgi:acetyl-CoA carboxylase biotin carboxyl carrier protein|tara:strand:+ start:708 stop:1181 length:474 start_codon:yes stop_codon:yes gene_type:complete
MDIKDIQHLIKFVAKSGAQEVKLEMEDIKITIKTGSDKPIIETSGMVQQLQAPTQIQEAPEALAREVAAPLLPSEEDHFITIKSPIIGTFYRKASPDKPSFVEVGKTINDGDVLCVIEAMKLFNEIESEVSGTIVKILVDDASPVEFDQPLFVINPS